MSLNLRRRHALLAMLTAPVAALTASPARAQGGRKLLIHVGDNDEGQMRQAFVIARNTAQYYEKHGMAFEVAILAIGGGLHMYRLDTSNHADTMARLRTDVPGIKFLACGNTIKGMKEQEGAPIDLLPGVEVVPVGGVAIVEMQAAGYAYLRP